METLSIVSEEIKILENQKEPEFYLMYLKGLINLADLLEDCTNRHNPLEFR